MGLLPHHQNHSPLLLQDVSHGLILEKDYDLQEIQLL